MARTLEADSRRRCLAGTAATAAIALASLLWPAYAPAGAGGQVLAVPAAGRIYHAAFPEFGGPEDHVTGDRIRRFEQLAGKRIAWAYFSNNWLNDIHFPSRAVRRIHRAGRVPFIRLMARSGFDEGGPDATYTMQAIVDGSFDPALRAWADRAASRPYPLLVEFGTEVNGDWFPWNGRWNGAGATTGYGDPAIPDGPERFRDAYRHVVDLFRSRGADNLTWFFHADVYSEPQVSWNKIAQYYPGDAYVDWIGISDYGPQEPSDHDWTSFAARLDEVYSQFTALSPSKPLAVLEYGAAEHPDHARKARWMRRAIAAVARHRWPRVRALAWWHEAWENSDGSRSDLHINSSPQSLRAYRHGIARDVFTGRPRFKSR